ncbi:MAG: sister chromatid cohesion protein PDS5 [Chloroflexi bacterium]|nr:sister chromatid cohesion protein PDS5 [Chloroflexota bacterium]
MDVSEYRQQFAAELDAATQQQTTLRDLLGQSAPATGQGFAAVPAIAPGAADELSAAAAVMRDKARPQELRLAAMTVISTAVGAHPELLDGVLAVLQDQTEPEEVRLAALGIVQQSSFQVVSFAASRPDYLAALRTLVDDPHADLRRRAMGILAREKDEYVQRRLIEGLQSPSKALVAPDKAIQFLGYDLHAEYVPLLRQLIAQPPSRAAKREAVRLLSADPSSADLLAQLLGDKKESRDIRNLSAIALQSIAPEEFHQQARSIVLDEDEDDHLRISVVTALTHFADPDSLRQDTDFTRRMEQVRTQSTSPQLRRAAQAYITRFGA